MTIWTAPYELRLRGGHGKARSGALLKIENQTGTGFADLHPWPELGDLKLNDQLNLLRDGQPTLQTKRSLGLAECDRVARVANQSAFKGLVIPKSHYLVTHLDQLESGELDRALSAGFTHLKMKVGRDFAFELSKLNEFKSMLAKFHLRLDFNSLVSDKALRSFLSSIPLEFNIDFLEDPLAWTNESWQALQRDFGFSLALDRAGDGIRISEKDSGPISWMIVKPAVQEPMRLANKPHTREIKICVTSYLDHPIGQMGAAFEAARLGLKADTVCGLLSQVAYESNVFSENMNFRGPTLLPTEGLGIGFGDILEKQSWKKLVAS